MLKYTENPVPRQSQDAKRGWWCIFGVSLVFVSYSNGNQSCESDAIAAPD